MARGAKAVLECDIALSWKGRMGPRGRHRFRGHLHRRGHPCRALNLGSRPVRARLRTQTAHHAFDLARRYLSGLPFED